MPFWIALLITIGFSILGQLLAPKQAGPKAEERPQLPEIDETRPIPVLWGEWLITSPQLFWWGDYQSTPIKKKIFTGFWFKKITTGFKYSLGMCMGLSDAGSGSHPFENRRGIEGITEIQINEKTLWTGDVGQNGLITIDSPNFFGGNGEGGNGGVKAKIEVHTGDYTPTQEQVRSTYLQTQLTRVPTWRGLGYIVWRGSSSGFGYYGNSASISPMAVKAYRRPNLGLLPGPGEGTETFAHLPGTKDANPVHCLVELLCNDDWGMGDVTLSDFDQPAWRAAAETVYNEGNGFSYYWDRQTSIEQMGEIILKQIDGVIFTDLSTGLITIKLARQDYDVDDLPVFGNDAFLEITNLTRGAWDDTIGEVRVTYTDHSKNFKSVSVFDNDIANVRSQEGDRLSTQIDYPGVSNETNARNLARRDLQVLTQALLRFSGTIDRTAHNLNPGDAFVFEWPEQGIESVVMRVTTMRPGTLESGVIELECCEDKFSAATALFTNTGTGWTEPVGDAAPVVNGEIAELPYYFPQDDEPRVYPLADRPNASQNSYQVVLEGVVEEDSASFTPTGTLAADLDRNYDAFDNDAFTIQNVVDIGLIPTGSEANARAGITLIRINDELMAYRIGNPSGTDFIVDEVYRGLLDTVPQDHPAGSRVWFIGANIELIEKSYETGTTINAEFLTQTQTGVLDSASAPDYSLVIDRRALRPYRPTGLIINGNTTGDTLSAGDVVLIAKERNRLTETDTILGPADSSVEPELRTEYYFDIYGNANTFLRRVGPLTSPSFTYTNGMEVTDGGALQTVLTFLCWSRRDGLASHQAFTRRVKRSGSFPGTFPTYAPLTDSYSPPAEGSVISGVPVNGSPSGTNNVPVFNPSTGVIEWQPAPGSSFSLTVKESDSTPTVSGVSTIKFKTPDFVVVDEGSGIVRVEKSADPGADFNLIITHDAEVCVDEDSGEVVYYF